MMDVAGAHVVIFLGALSQAHARLANAANEVRLWPGVVIARAVGATLAASPFRLGTDMYDGAISFGMGAKWRDGRSVEWSILICWTAAEWIVEGDVGLEQDDGRRILQEMGRLTASSVEECLRNVDESIDRLEEGLPALRAAIDQL